VEPGVNLAELDKTTQQRRIQIQFSKKGKPKSIVVHKPWLMGGGVDEVILFCGNPGVGESTLCNSIFQEGIFQSGINLGSGMTTKQQSYI